jgi:hypothetical protein
MDIDSLNTTSHYHELVRYFDENKSKPYEEWLTFDRILDKPGKQGIVGLFKTKQREPVEVIFKISQYINYLVQHELTIMQGLKDVSNFCPHFCRGIGMIETKIDAKYKKNCTNPFEITNNHPIDKDVLLAEYIDDSCKFYNYIRSEKIEEDVLYSIVKQVILATSFAQKLKKFSHYDLHSFNVMVKECDRDIVFLYKIDTENQFCVPSFGSYPVIIDFGFSYIENMNDAPLWPSMAHTDVGFMSDRFDWVADPKLFLVTVSQEIKHKRGTKKARRFRRIVKNMFNPLTIDWQSGWDEHGMKGASEQITKVLDGYNKVSDLFYKYDCYCIDIIQTLIILPLQPQAFDNLKINFVTFLNEWVKIENLILNPFYNIYILKSMVDVARTIRPEYMNKATKNEAVRIFRQSLHDSINSVAKFCNPKDIHYEKLLCSLYLFATSVEGMLFNAVNKTMSMKEHEYKNLPVSNIEEIYGVLSVNLKDNYIYNENTKILFMDLTKQNCFMYKPPVNEIHNINKISHLARGTYINDLIFPSL